METRDEDCWAQRSQLSLGSLAQTNEIESTCKTPDRWDDIGSMQVHVGLLHTMQESTLNHVHNLEMQMGLVEQQLQRLQVKDLTQQPELGKIPDIETPDPEEGQNNEACGESRARGLRSIAQSIASSTAKGLGATEGACKRTEGARGNWVFFLLAVSVVSFVSILMSVKGIFLGESSPKASKMIHDVSPYHTGALSGEGKASSPPLSGVGSAMTIHATGEISAHQKQPETATLKPNLKGLSNGTSGLSETASALLEGNEGWTALHAAASVGNVAVAKALMQRHTSTDVNAKDAHGCTALHYAADRGHLDIVVALLNNARFAEVNAKDVDGRTALHRAARSGQTSIVKVLLEHAGEGASFTEINEKDNDGKTALHHATFFGHLGTTMTLLNHSRFTEVNAKDASRCTVLHYAAASGHIDVMEAVMNHSRFTDVNAKSVDGWTVLNYAIESGHVGVVKAILRNARFTSVNTKDDRGWSVLHFAASLGYIGIAQAILHYENFREVNAKAVDGSNALHVAVDGGHAQMVAVLLNVQDLAVNDKDAMGRTALHHAVIKNRVDLVEKILRHGRFTGIKAKDNLGRTALEASEMMRHAAVADAISHHLSKLEAQLEAHLLEMIEPGE